MRADGQHRSLIKLTRRDCNICGREFYGHYRTCVVCWRKENGFTVDEQYDDLPDPSPLKRSHAKVGGDALRTVSDAENFHLANRPRKDGVSYPSDESGGSDDESERFNGDGELDVIEIDSDDEEMLAGDNGDFEEEGEDTEEASDEDWQGIAKFLGDDLIDKLRNKKK